MKEMARTTIQDAERIGLAALGWIANDGEQISRFCALTGIDPSDIRSAAQRPEFLAGVLEYLLNHEPTLKAFCEDTGIDIRTVLPALHQLPGGRQDYERSI